MSDEQTDLLPDSPIEIDPSILVQDVWQENATDLMVKRRSMGLGAEMGLGKTPPTLKALHIINPTSSLIVVTKRAFLAWRRMMKQWFPEMWAKYQVIMIRNDAIRRAQWDLKKDFVITTWTWLLKDGQRGWIKRFNFQQVTCDECHKFIRGRDTKTRAMLKRFSWLGIFLITGSPVSKGAEQFWSYLNLINPKLFPSYWKWVHTFCNVIDGPFGKEIWGAKNLDSLHSVLRQHFIVIEKKDLGKVKKRRQFLDAEMTDGQQRAYNSLRDQMFLEVEGGDLLVTPTPMVTFLRMRQVLCCPAILDPRLGYGGGLEAILEELKDLDKADRHCVIFTPFREAVHIIATAVETHLELPAFKFMGGLEPDELEQLLLEWKRTRGIAVNTIKFAESYDMETTDKIFMLGYEWDPYENRQAEDRVDRRNNSHAMIRAMYVRIAGTYDDDVMENIVLKSRNLNAMYNDPIKLIQILKLKSVP